MKRRPDPLLRLQPWKVVAVFQPVESILHRIEVDGTVEAAGRQVVFREDGQGVWYDAVAALRGVIEFFEIAAARYGLSIDVQPMARFANKLDSWAPLFDTDLLAVRTCIAECKVLALRLRQSQAEDIIRTVQISAEFDKVRRAA